MKNFTLPKPSKKASAIALLVILLLGIPLLLYQSQLRQIFKQFASQPYQPTPAPTLTPPTPTPTLPMCPAGVANNIGYCRWDPLDGAGGYDVTVKEASTGAVIKQETASQSATQSGFVMEAGKAYTCTVNAINYCGAGTAATSSPKICQIPESAPYCPAEPLKESSCVWDLLEGATAYKVDIIDVDQYNKQIKSEVVNQPYNRLVYPTVQGHAYKCAVTPISACAEGKQPTVSEPKVCLTPSGIPYPSVTEYPSPSPSATVPPSEAPTPTATPVPTSTPIPTSTPRPTPTPKIVQLPPQVIQQPGQIIIQRGGVQVVQQPQPTAIVLQQPTVVIVQGTPRPTVQPTGDTNIPVIIGGITLITALMGALLFFAL